MDRLLIQNGRVFADGALQTLDLLIEDGRIAALLPTVEHRPDAPVLDAAGLCAAPGFLDIHTHGGDGVDINHAGADDLRRLARFFARQGTTGFLCSVLTDTPEQTLWCIEQIREAMRAPTGGAKVLGVHLEGPFLAPEYKGAMPEHLLRPGDPALLERYLEAAQGAVRYVTVSPEIEGAEALIRQVTAAGAAAAIGHSGADYETSMRCIGAGAICATHTGNAMRLIHQHEPALLGAVLESDIHCEMICDGRHLHPAFVRLLMKVKGSRRLCAVTDSIMAAGLPDGRYKLGVNDVIVQDGDAKLETGTRAGSTLTTGKALQNLLAFTGRDAEELLPILTETPARVIGVGDRKGRLAPGYDADIVLLDEAWGVRYTLVDGTAVYAVD